MNHVTREEALALRAEHNAAPPTTTPWEAHVVTDEQGTDTHWRIDAPEAAVEALAELSNVGEGAQTDARYIARAVNLHARLFETVIAQAEQIASERGPGLATGVTAGRIRMTVESDAAIAALWRRAKGARRLADQGKAIEGAGGPVSVEALEVRAVALEAAAQLASFILRGGFSKPAPGPVEALALAAAPPECTGLSAGWCPNCGDCTCPDRAEAMDTKTCPLHGPDSRHAATLCAGGCGQVVAEEGHRCPLCEVAHLRRELAKAHAIIEGSTVPPTRAEIDAHGGEWLVWDFGTDACPADKPLIRDRLGAMRTADHAARFAWRSRWWPVDSQRRPCAKRAVAPEAP